MLRAFVSASRRAPPPAAVRIPPSGRPVYRPSVPVSNQSPRPAVWTRTQTFLGITGRSEWERRERQIRVSLVCSLLFAGLQAILVAVLVAISFANQIMQLPFVGRSEFDVCPGLGVADLVWAGGSLLAAYLKLWSFFTSHGRRLRPESDMCPLDLKAFHTIIAKVMPIAIVSWFIVIVMFFIRHRHICLPYAPHLTALTFTIVALACIRFLIGCAFSLIPRTTFGARMIPPAPRALTQAEVDRLPVVLYIPSPSDNSPVSPISLPERAFNRPSPFQYPPSPTQRKTHRFVFWQPHRRPIHDGEEDANPVDVEQGGAGAGADWERAACRSVCLPAYRAQCSICLVDFEAPGKLDESAIRSGEGEGDVEMTPVSARETTNAQARDTGDMHSRVEMPLSTDTSVSQGAGTEYREALRLLRMLGCGHVYHKECIDRWLTVEAQQYCPYCRRMVEIPAEHAVRSWPRWRRGTV